MDDQASKDKAQSAETEVKFSESEQNIPNDLAQDDSPPETSEATTAENDLPDEKPATADEPTVVPAADSEVSVEENHAMPMSTETSRKEDKAKKTFTFSKKAVFIFIGVLVLAFGVSAYLILQENEKPSSTQEVTTQQADNSSTAQTPTTENQSYALSEAKFTGTLESYPYQPLFSEAALTKYYYGDSTDLTATEDLKTYVSYYKVGTEGTKDILYVKLAPIGPDNDTYALIVKDGTTFTLYKNHSYGFFSEDGTYSGPDLDTGVTIDTTQIVNQIIEKDTINYANVTASKTGGVQFPNEYSQTDLQEVEKINEGIVYESVAENEYHKGIKQFKIFLKQPTGMYVPYRYTTDILKDDNSVEITWENGTKTTETYDWAMVKGGCGVTNSVNVLDKSDFDDLIEVGKAGEDTVYKINSKDHQVFKSIYDSYYYEGRENAATAQEFYDNNGMIVVRNKLGYRVILVNNKYQAGGECGKPVVYLYPETPTEISVEVGADVSISIPEYGNGWNAFAMPDGRIFVDNTEYPYLFWEGTGHGQYPEITEGFIVKSSAIEATLREHLQKLGLNERESADFLEFWLPLMPKTAYTRLTWLGTQQMNELAPLKLSKKPDTLIRVFLDFQGLDKPIALKEQRLSHPERKGFVVIEWGGLRYAY